MAKLEVASEFSAEPLVICGGLSSLEALPNQDHDVHRSLSVGSKPVS
jgi:hypothetical protein